MIEFPDTYQDDLVELYGWNGDQARKKVDKMINHVFKERGLIASVYWEDRGSEP